jgi:hypothetical protein
MSPSTGDGDGDSTGDGDGDVSDDAGATPPDEHPPAGDGDGDGNGDGDGDASGLDSGIVAQPGDGGDEPQPGHDASTPPRVDAGDGDSSADSGVIEPPPPPPPAPCNGHPELCARRFDEVIYPCTHNAHSAEAYGFSTLNRNQKSGFDKQLADGIRCMLVDVYDKSGEHMFCHNPDLCFLGSLGHKEGLDIIKTFLDEHPREVLTLIYENGMSGNAIAEDMQAVGIDDVAYHFTGATTWPTLGEMIDANQRLVVTIQDGGSDHDFVRNVWDVAWDTPYTFFAASEFSCDQNRGSRNNPLFLLNHWLNSKIPILNIEKPDESKADEANAYEMLYGRATGCWSDTNRMPNFVAVDFYEHGDLFRVVDRLNGF